MQALALITCVVVAAVLCGIAWGICIDREDGV